MSLFYLICAIEAPLWSLSPQYCVLPVWQMSQKALQYGKWSSLCVSAISNLRSVCHHRAILIFLSFLLSIELPLAAEIFLIANTNDNHHSVQHGSVPYIPQYILTKKYKWKYSRLFTFFASRASKAPDAPTAPTKTLPSVNVAALPVKKYGFLFKWTCMVVGDCLLISTVEV